VTELIVVDDFPVGPDDLAGRELARLLARASTDTHVLLLCSKAPAVDPHLLGADPELALLTSADLVMDLEDVSDVLVGHGLTVPDAGVRAIGDRTAGWARGVRLAALFLQRSGSLAEALSETDRAVARYLDAAVLSRMADPALALLTATSMVPDVAYGAAQSIVGPAVRQRLRAIEDTRGFVEVRSDGSFECHPLLRRVLLERLRQEPSRARQASRRAAEWFADAGDEQTALDIAVDAGDWRWAARRLVESLAVPRLLILGTDGVAAHADAVEKLGHAEPLLLATAALHHRWPDLAEPAIERAECGLTDGTTALPDRLSLAVLRMAAARLRGDARVGLQQASETSRLSSRLGLSQRASTPELLPLLHSHLGLFELWHDAPERAREAFERGARAFQRGPTRRIESATQMAAADCLGQLAWLEAVGGELRGAVRHAAEVLTARPADSTEIGVLHAQLATVWAHVARGEFEQAGQRLDSLILRHPEITDREIQPGSAAAAGLTTARLALVVGDASGRCGCGRGWVGRLSGSPAAAGWFDEQLRLVRAETELDAGQPAQALQILREPGRVGAETLVLRARAWIELGDLASVDASLRALPVEPLTVTTQIQLELIQAWLAQARCDRHRQRILVDRALRTAGREQLRTPISWAKSWLHAVVTSDRELLGSHGVFVSSIRSPRLRDAGRVTSPMPLSDALTERELEVLQRLGSLSTNDEIAADLFLSPNTVKTHLKSMFRKLDVTRRSDAFRRGRELGLC
jgi:LuxR family maltose regulon positive regulatory protein